MATNSSASDKKNSMPDLNDKDDLELDLHCKTCDKKFSGFIPYEQHLQSGVHHKNVTRQQTIEKLSKTIENAEKEDDNEDSNDLIIPKPFATCQTCEKDFTGPQSYQQHLIGKTHRKKLAEKKALESLRQRNLVHSIRLGEVANVEQHNPEESQSDDSSSDTSDDEILVCPPCNVAFSGTIPYIQHITSKPHKKKLKQIKKLRKLKKSMLSSKSHVAEGINNEDLNCTACDKSFPDLTSTKAHLRSLDHEKNAEKVESEMKKLNVAKEDTGDYHSILLEEELSQLEKSVEHKNST